MHSQVNSLSIITRSSWTGDGEGLISSKPRHNLRRLMHYTRSGKLLYLPDNRRSCCPHYTIRLLSQPTACHKTIRLTFKFRLPTGNFQPSRDQRQTLNRWNRFVLGDTYASAYAKLYPRSKTEKRASKEQFDLVSAVHSCETDHIAHAEPKPEHAFTVHLESDAYTEEKFAIFEKYQRVVHKEDAYSITRSGFKQFLCSSPISYQEPVTVSSRQALTASTAGSGAETKKSLGSYHQLYRLDGVLIALSVLDLLPHAVSAVYFIYDPTYEKHSLGKISALREIALAEEYGHAYYYMGYYIHDCAKMKYKADFKPQEVLDMSQGADALSWTVLDEDAKQKMTDRTFGLPHLPSSLSQELETIRSPVSAASAGRSLLTMAVPGVLPTSMLVSPHFDLQSVIVAFGGKARGTQKLVPAGMLNIWSEDDGEDDEERTTRTTLSEIQKLEQPGSAKANIAELVAAVGLEVARGLIIDFSASA